MSLYYLICRCWHQKLPQVVCSILQQDTWIWGKFMLSLLGANFTDFYLYQVIHGLLDRVMQLLEVPFTQDGSGYFIKAIDGMHTDTFTHSPIPVFQSLSLTHVYVCMHTHTRTHTRARTHTHTHTHTHTRTHTQIPHSSLVVVLMFMWGVKWLADWECCIQMYWLLLISTCLLQH